MIFLVSKRKIVSIVIKVPIDVVKSDVLRYALYWTGKCSWYAIIAILIMEATKEEAWHIFGLGLILHACHDKRDTHVMLDISWYECLLNSLKEGVPKFSNIF